jgi:hypothetical protein
MQILPVRSCAIRMAILLCVVVTLDAAAALFIAKPLLWCATIPALIPLLTPAVIFSTRVQSKN